MRFKVIVEKGEDGYYVVTVPSLPGCISQAKTRGSHVVLYKEGVGIVCGPTPQKSLTGEL